MDNSQCTVHNEGKNERKIEENKITDAKPISKWVMVLAAVITIGYNLFVVIKTGKIPTLDQQQSILMLGGGLIIFFSPVYLSIWLDKVFGGKK